MSSAVSSSNLSITLATVAGGKKGETAFINRTEFQTTRVRCRKQPWKTPHALQIKVYCKSELDGNTAPHKSLASRPRDRARLCLAWCRKGSTPVFCKGGKVAGESKAKKRPQSWILCWSAPVLPRNYSVNNMRDKTAPRVFFRKHSVTSLQPGVLCLLHKEGRSDTN